MLRWTSSLHQSIYTGMRRRETYMDRPYAVILADGHRLVRQGLWRIIEETGGIQVVGEAADGAQLLEILRTRIPDMVIVDISMPSFRNNGAIEKIIRLYADTKVLFLSLHDHQEYLNYVLDNGADGFVLKQNVDVELFPAIEKIRRGETYISPVVGHGLLGPGK